MYAYGTREKYKDSRMIVQSKSVASYYSINFKQNVRMIELLEVAGFIVENGFYVEVKWAEFFFFFRKKTHTHSTLLHSTPLHSTPLHSTPLHSTRKKFKIYFCIEMYSIEFKCL